MAFAEYTKCIKPSSFVDLTPEGLAGKLYVGAAGLSFLSMIALAAFVGSTAAIINAIVLLTQVIVFLAWWLYGRLICLGDDARNCAIIGKVTFKGSNPKKKGGDNDFTMNLLLAPRDNYDEDVKKVDFVPDLPQGHLYTDHPDILGLGKAYAGGDDSDRKYWQGLHIEFEGRGIYDLYLLSIAMIALLIAALFVPWPWNLILVALAFLLILAKFIHGLFDDKDSPNLDTPLDTDSNGGTIYKGVVVVLKGEWIYDSGHLDGKNEIHPIRECMIIGELKGDAKWSDLIFTDPDTQLELDYGSAANIEIIRDHWCGAFKDANDAEDEGSRDDPKNDWGIHPSIDGCKAPIIVL